MDLTLIDIEELLTAIQTVEPHLKRYVTKLRENTKILQEQIEFLEQQNDLLMQSNDQLKLLAAEAVGQVLFDEIKDKN